MAAHRRVEGEDARGVNHVVEQMDALGYTGDWKIVSAEDFYLPQHRPRVWMLFVLRPEASETGRQRTLKVLQEASAVLEQVQTKTTEGLAKVLARLGGKAAAKRDGSSKTGAKTHPKPISEGTTTKNEAFKVKHDLSEHDLRGWETFQAKVGHLLNPRALESFFLNLCMRRKKDGWNFLSDDRLILTGTPGQSVEWLTLMRDRFPAVTPHGPFVVLRAKEAFIATGWVILAMQGIQQAEAKYLKLKDMPVADPLLHDLGGNGFTANVCVGYILAALASVPVGWRASAETQGSA